MHSWKFILLAAIGFLAVSCGPARTSVVIKQGNPQQFFVSGRGTFDILTVHGPDKDYWVIQPVYDLDVSSVTNPIVYGQVPPGFRQYTPANGPPPPISDGNTYGIKIGARDGKCGVVNTLFVVRDEKIILVQRLLESMRAGHPLVDELNAILKSARREV